MTSSHALLLLLVAASLAVPQEVGPTVPADPLHHGVKVPEGSIAIIDGIVVSEAAFLDEMVRRYLRPGQIGQDVLGLVIEEALVRAALSKRGIEVDDAEVQELYNHYERQMRETQKGLELAKVLAEQGIKRSVFLQKLRHVAGLQKLARQDMKLPEDTEVTNLHMRTWLQQNRENAVMVTDTAELPAGTVAIVDGEPVSARSYVLTLLDHVPPQDTARVVDTLLQEVVADRLLAANHIKLTDEELDREFAFQKRRFESDPTHQGITFEEILKQQGWDPDRFRRSRGVKINAAVSLLGKHVFTTPQVEAAYEENKNLYGPVIRARRILIPASDKADVGGTYPSFENALVIAKKVLKEIQEGARFEDQARLYSADTQTRFRGGSLEPFAPGRSTHGPEVTDALLLAEPGIPAGPVRSPKGWEILLLEGRTPAPPVEDVTPDVRRLLAEKMWREAFETKDLGVDVRL